MGEGGGYWAGFVNGDDSFHNVINMLDFPLESVEGDSGVNVGDWESQFQRLGPISSQVLQGINAPVSRDNVANIFVLSDATYERKQRPDIPEIYSSSTPHDSSITKKSSFFRTSPTSVLESSSSCSAEKIMSSSPELIIPVRPRSKIPRRSTFNKWHLLSPVTPSKRNMKEKFHKKKKKKLIHLLADFEIKESPSGHRIPNKRCAHCQATETPPWRRGPPGRKMLCNACGVRYGHGLLFADYGPATERTQLSADSETAMLSTFWGKRTKHSDHSEINIIFPQRVSTKRCSHCQVTETPQWRNGPTGRGTLCNACGVRYRLGSLPQEYRPAVKLAADSEIVAQHSANSERVGQHSASSEKPAKSSSHFETKKNSSHQHAPVKRCTHCQVTKTPQWREGPMGRKTLCNACGVRYRSGRLLPEYRPSASPTFVPTLHSNSHRKVVEMRSQSIRDSLKPETDPAVSPTRISSNE